MKKHNCLVIVITGLILLVGVGTSFVQATPIYVDHAQFVRGGTTWYYPALGGFILHSSFTYNGIISIEGVDGYDYAFSGNMNMVTPLVSDDSNPTGDAKGYFQGGATVTVTGSLWNKTLYPAGNDPDKYTGTVLTGAMQISSSETWLVREEQANDWFVGTVYFDAGTTAGSGLGAGIPIAGGNELKLDEFKLDFTFSGNGNVTSFLNSNIITSTTTEIQMSAVPEPVSVLLFGLGSVFCVGCRRKRNKV